jgi:hypothetical protein
MIEYVTSTNFWTILYISMAKFRKCSNVFFLGFLCQILANSVKRDMGVISKLYVMAPHYLSKDFIAPRSPFLTLSSYTEQLPHF